MITHFILGILSIVILVVNRIYKLNLDESMIISSFFAMNCAKEGIELSSKKRKKKKMHKRYLKIQES